MADGATGGGAAFWRFSLALYARPGVAAALLALQDRVGRDVNLILYALWLGAVHRRRLDPAALGAAAAAVAASAGIVAELRGLRRRLRDAADPRLQTLRRCILAVELAGERSAQSRLAASLAADPPAAAAGDRLAQAVANLELYLGPAGGAAETGVLHAALASLMRRSAG
jgi:uncharacterized protein (TIGR02444 family)